MPLPLFRKCVAKKKRLDAKAAARAPPPGDDDPMPHPKPLKSRNDRSHRSEVYLRRKAGDRSGLRGRKDTEHIGKYRDGVLKVTPHDLSRSSGSGSGSSSAAGKPALTRGKPPTKKLGWRRKGGRKK